ncbi:MAG: DUF5017 domain-containing protein [Fermentimonas sp.]|jgi:hypothetical protein
MKIRYYFLVFIITNCFFSCEKEFYQNVDFDVKVLSEHIVSTIGDTIVVNSNTPITFNFIGEQPDLITFFSGEKTHEFDKKDLYEIPIEEIESSELSFIHLPKYGVIEGTLRVFLSTDFNGLLLNDKSKDSTEIVSHKWMDVTEKCNLSKISKLEQKTVLSIKEYLGNKLTIAFQYITDQNEKLQPTHEILGLEIVNKLSNGDEVVIKTMEMGFSPIDLFELVNPYVSGNKSGLWNLARIKENPSMMRIELSQIGAPLNNDWLISKPLKLNKRLADKGTGIKNTTVSLDNFDYTFVKPGVYKTTFVARNYNYKNFKEEIRVLHLKVI